jgi:hypothetical protein
VLSFGHLLAISILSRVIFVSVETVTSDDDIASCPMSKQMCSIMVFRNIDFSVTTVVIFRII